MHGTCIKVIEFQEYCLGGGEDGRGVELPTLTPSCADCLEIWEPLKLLGPSEPVQELVCLEILTHA